MITIKVPDGKIGKWEVATFHVSESDAAYFNATERRKERYMKAGVYKKIMRDGQIIMSNTRAEYTDHLPFIEKATGDVLIFGLGLGMVVEALIEKESVNSIKVIELDNDVIELVGKYYVERSKKVTIQQGDALTMRTSGQYDAIWFDIWDDIDQENLSQMSLLKRRWRKRSAIRLCWAEKECRRLAREERYLYV